MSALAFTLGITIQGNKNTNQLIKFYLDMILAN